MLHATNVADVRGAQVLIWSAKRKIQVSKGRESERGPWERGKNITCNPLLLRARLS